MDYIIDYKIELSSDILSSGSINTLWFCDNVTNKKMYLFLNI